MIRADRKEQIDKTIERRAGRIVLFKLVGFALVLYGAVVLGCWALVSRWG